MQRLRGAERGKEAEAKAVPKNQARSAPALRNQVAALAPGSRKPDFATAHRSDVVNGSNVLTLELYQYDVPYDPEREASHAFFPPPRRLRPPT